MNCLLIFDHLNDVVHMKYNEEFLNHMNDFSLEQEFISLGSRMSQLDDNIIMQCFSPIITSHRIMNCQFGNSYNYVKCEGNLVIYFEEYMGYLFVAISDKKEEYMKKFTNLCVTVVRYLCGPDVYQLKVDTKKSTLMDKLIDGWMNLDSNDQAIHVEAVEQLTVNPDLTSTTIQILRESVDHLISQIECKKIHALVLVQNKFLSLYSSPTAKELSSTDIVFLTILSHSTLPEKTESETISDNISSHQILLAGPEGNPKCLPHVVHITPLSNGINLLYLLEIGNPAVAASLYETFCHLHIMQQVQIQRDKEILQPAFENLDLANRKLNDSLKKNKNSAIELSHKQLVKKWEVIKKKYQEYLKSTSEEALLRAETLGLGFLENLKELLGLTSVDDSVLISSTKYIKQVATSVGHKLDMFEDFFKAKGMKNFSFGSYLEEFPGLVHFLYIDRNTHRITTPTLDFTTQEGLFNKKKIWFMIDFARKYLQKGCMQLMWKDTTFHYAYFIWFEDNSGAPLKPSIFPNQILSLPGILCEDFYQKLKGICFPKMQISKIRCYELFCLHLGLVTASCVLEQNRRLAATISELRGHPSQATDFL
nr:Hermansky-Pudlak syndrome 1 protein homolog isoform X2 [Leptinotarsa decemlineata]